MGLFGAFNNMKQKVGELEVDLAKFENSGNNAAGTQARVELQAIKKLAQEMRAEISTIKQKRKG